MPSLVCPVCLNALNRPAQTDFGSGRPVDWLDCPRCGVFGLENAGAESLKWLIGDDENKRILLRHSLAKIVSNNRLPIIARDVLERILKDGTLPTPAEQADNLVLWLGKNSQGPGRMVALDPERHGPIIGSHPSEGFAFIAGSLQKQGVIEASLSIEGMGQAQLTFRGWERFYSLQRATTESHAGFMAMKYGEAETDRLFYDFIKPAVALAGFDLRRLDDRPKAGLIDHRMEVDIRTSRFLVADLTHTNRGAYWEAGFAAGLGKPVFYLCETSVFERAGTHFDTNHHYTIKWSASDMRAAADELKDAIRATLPADAKLTDE